MKPAPSARRRYPTEVALALPGLACAAFVLAPMMVLAAGFEPGSGRLAQILIGNWISPLIVWVFAASIVFLVLKGARQRREQAATELLRDQIIPTALEDGVTLRPKELLDRLRAAFKTAASTPAPHNLLLHRLHILLDAEGADPSAVEAAEQEAGWFDRQYLTASFAVGRFMIWAIPILGFIGTVWGISGAVSNFSSAMTSVESAAAVSEALKDNLPLVTADLATAFDTTLLALLLSVPIMLGLTWLEKSEGNYLTSVDEAWAVTLGPQLVRAAGMHEAAPGAGVAAAPGQPASLDGSGGVGADVRQLGEQVAALQRVMADLHDTVFAARLAREDSDSQHDA